MIKSKHMKYFGIFILALTFVSCAKQGCKAKLDGSCICTADYNPVCGCDEVTYSNACTANCSGIENYTSGTCK
jgi:hypothetical protein